MQPAGPLDFLPLWGVFLVTVAVILLAIEGGFRLGMYRRRRSVGEDKPPVGEMVAATLALLAFILAFTFGLAGSWFDVRRRLVVDEANAIGTTYLRAGMLPEPHRSDVRKLLREYVDVRLEAAQPGKLGESIRRSEELHTRLWAHATAVAEKQPSSVVVGLFIWSLNEVIDLHTKRLTLGPRTRLPGTIWATLYFVAVLGMSCDRIPRWPGRRDQVAGDHRARLLVLGGLDADRRHRPPPGRAPPYKPAAPDRPSKEFAPAGGRKHLRPARGREPHSRLDPCASTVADAVAMEHRSHRP